MRKLILLAAILCTGLSHAALADGRTWNWIFISPTPDPATKSGWWTEQGTAKDDSIGRSFDIRIGGTATAAEPNRLALYELKGTVRGNSVTATLIGLDTDETPERYSGKLVTTEGVDRISLLGTSGIAILLYVPSTKSN
jgi:hypothetical protein